ncbi:MAG: DUF6364 family protein [Bacteroidota bacterium]
MTTKLTLTIEEQVIKTAKKYAGKKGRSLSGLVENYLKTLAAEDNQKDEMTPRVKRLTGSIKLPANFDYKKMLEEGVAKKHGK